MDQRSWKSNELKLDEGGWEPADYNVNIDGIEYGWWRRTLREHRHGLTVISHYKAPSGQGWEIVGKASSLDEEVYVMSGVYYDKLGQIIKRGPAHKYSNSPAHNRAVSRPT